MEWMWLKTARRKLTDTSGLGLGSKTSQMRSLPPTWNSLQGGGGGRRLGLRAAGLRFCQQEKV
jgi:hypothetical protein